MKRSTWLIMIFALFLVGSTTLVGQTSAAEKTIFTATDTFDPLNLLGGGVVGAILSPGTVACPGFEPTGNPAQPCPPGSRINTRGFTILTRFIASDPRITGNATITINANFAADGNGPAWGTISVDIDGDAGTWDGTWQGLRVKEGTNIWVIPVHGSLKGNGGSVDGMVLRTLDTIYSYTLAVIAYEGDIEGRIIDPNSK
jgi:hypothetical protein